jgi:multiple sugar transport system substrate-binding protein
MGQINLQGITWGHSRGITPLLAASQRYNELHPGVEIHWKKRSLQEFADFPIENLTSSYDLLIIDHPWVGRAAATNCVLPLDEYLSPGYLRDQHENSAGQSHNSYNYNNKQWALAIDAATPAASCRKDLLDKHNIAIPQQWQELIALAKMGRIAIPAIPIDVLMNFYSFCIALGKTPFQSKAAVIDKETGARAIDTMKELYALVDKKMFDLNPIAVAELMASTDDYWYCPFAYCYSNYSRNGFAKNLLEYSGVVEVNGVRLHTTIGGTGLAVSAFSEHKAEAIDFTQWIGSGDIQSTVYVQHGGQPGHRKAWLDEKANVLTNNFFTNLLPQMDIGYMRPRYDGYLHFQDNAGLPLQKCLLENGDPIAALNEMNSIYLQSHVCQNSKAAV